MMTPSERSLSRAQGWLTLALALWAGWNLRWAVDGGSILKWPWAFLFALVDAGMFFESIRLSRRAREQALIESRLLKLRVEELIERLAKREDPNVDTLVELLVQHHLRGWP